MDYSISNSWNIIFNFKAFSLELDDETRGAMDELQLTLEYRLLKNVFIGGGINLRNVNLKLEDDDARWHVSSLSRGAQAYAGLRF